MASNHPLSAWLAEIFFEDNARFGRRSPRLLGMLRKVAATAPAAAALLFCNFTSTYPRSKAASAPQPDSPAEGLDLTLTEWPRSAMDGHERGLPYSDSVAQTVRLGDALASVNDLLFAMRELHRVCANGAEVHVTPTDTIALASDPTLVRPVTGDTLAFFTAAAPEKARRLGVSGLFAIESKEAAGMVLRIVKSAAPTRPLKIDIGCGSSPKPGYSGIDFLDLPGVDIVRDVEKHGLPFSDSTISNVYTAHFLEHVHDLVFVMNEIHRVCCHDGIVDISVPTLLGPYAAADPTHVHFFNARTFSYFEAGSEPYAGITKGFEILEQSVGFSLNVKLRVVKR
ncbi:MAG TPA: methyltransferase domain-containing protein [Gemmatimonadaceae bacterium]